MQPKEQRKVDDFIIYAMAAATQALTDAGWKPTAYEDQIRTGVLIGSGIGAQGIEKTSLLFAEKGPRRVSPFFIPGRLINLASGYVSIEHGLKGPNHAVVTACSTGAHAIGDASRLVGLGDADVMLAGGARSPVCRLAIAGFAACRALHQLQRGAARRRVARDRDRDGGFVMGEGAGMVVVEALGTCQGPRRQDLCRDHRLRPLWRRLHITAPAEDGDGAYRCMTAAVKRAGIEPADIDYIHGTSTPMGDEIEQRSSGCSAMPLARSPCRRPSLRPAICSAPPVRSRRSSRPFDRDNIAPPTLNLDNPSVATAIDLVPHKARRQTIDTVLSNSFGFGGTNASLILRRYDA